MWAKPRALNFSRGSTVMPKHRWSLSEATGGEIASKLTDTKWRFSLARAKTKSCYVKLMLRVDGSKPPLEPIKAVSGKCNIVIRQKNQSVIDTLGIEHKSNETRRRLLITRVVLTNF